jgi:hypothetical protein
MTTDWDRLNALITDTDEAGVVLVAKWRRLVAQVRDRNDEQLRIAAAEVHTALLTFVELDGDKDKLAGKLLRRWMAEAAAAMRDRRAHG